MKGKEILERIIDPPPKPYDMPESDDTRFRRLLSKVEVTCFVTEHEGEYVTHIRPKNVSKFLELVKTQNFGEIVEKHVMEANDKPAMHFRIKTRRCSPAG